MTIFQGAARCRKAATRRHKANETLILDTLWTGTNIWVGEPGFSCRFQWLALLFLSALELPASDGKA